jgi:hypothetical protein
MITSYSNVNRLSLEPGRITRNLKQGLKTAICWHESSAQRFKWTTFAGQQWQYLQSATSTNPANWSNLMWDVSPYCKSQTTCFFFFSQTSVLIRSHKKKFLRLKSIQNSTKSSISWRLNRKWKGKVVTFCQKGISWKWSNQFVPFKSSQNFCMSSAFTISQVYCSLSQRQNICWWRQGRKRRFFIFLIHIYREVLGNLLTLKSDSLLLSVSKIQWGTQWALNQGKEIMHFLYSITAS